MAFEKDGIRISSWNINKRGEKRLRELGWDGVEPKYAWFRRNGWDEEAETVKHRWLKLYKLPNPR